MFLIRLFRELFDYPELEEHPYLCNELAPKLKGRPRKRKKIKRAGSPESESASSESSVVSSSVSSKVSAKNVIKIQRISESFFYVESGTVVNYRFFPS